MAGLGGSAVRKILNDHNVERILSSEGGRTSRGNMERMSAYIDVLNELAARKALDLEDAERYWVERVLAYFDALPFTFRLDPSRSLRACVRDLLAQAVERQREVRGTMYAGAVMQHLVGAKLDMITRGSVIHHGFSVADAPSNRSGDFLIGDVAIHVTTAPGEALIRKCQGNLTSGLRPLIITTEDGVGGARALSRQAAVDDRLDVIEIEQFIATNIYEWSAFERDARPSTVRNMIDRYNRIVTDCESDPSLRIEFDGLTVDPVRSRTMRAVKSKNTTPEIAVRKLLHGMGYRFRLHRRDLPGSPDLVFPSRRLALFVHGCFWHGHDCPRGARIPKTNNAYWTAKIDRNRKRNAEAIRALSETGWRSSVIWECELRQPERLRLKLTALLDPGETNKGDDDAC